MLDVKDRIATAKDRVKKAEQAEVAAKQDLKNLTAQRDEVVEKLKEKGVTPETAPAELERLEKSVLENLEKVETMTPEV